MPQQAHELADLSLPHGFTQALGEAVGLQELIDVVAQWLPNFIDAERASIALLLDPADDVLVISAIGGVLVIESGTMLPVEGSLVGEAFRTRRTVNVEELIGRTETEVEALRAGNLRSALVAPLISGGEVLGTLNLGNLAPAAFTEHHEQVLEIIAGLVASFVRVHQVAERAAEQALTDELTGGLNRRAIFAHLDDIAHASDRETSLLYIDLDGFKMVNDEFGHASGDHVLRAIAGRVCDVVGDQGSFGRVGGDEFLVVVADDDGGELADKIASAIAQVCAMPITLDGNHVVVRASVGVATGTIGQAAVNRLVSEADQAMYAAKHRPESTVRFSASMETVAAI